MTLTVYNGEHFERSKWRYVGFSLTIIIVIGLSLRKQNIVGVILLFFILGAYMYYSVLSAQTTKLTIKDKYLAIGEKSMPRQNLTGYLIEGDKKTAKEYFTKCVATNLKPFWEYQCALAELKHLQTTE